MASISSLPMLLYECASLVCQIETPPNDTTAATANKKDHFYENIPKQVSLEGNYNRLKAAWLKLQPQAQTPEEIKTTILIWNTLENINNRVKAIKPPEGKFDVVDLNTPSTLQIATPTPQPSLPSIDESLKKWAEKQTEILFQQNNNFPLVDFLSNAYTSKIELYNRIYKSAQEAFDHLKGKKSDFESVSLMEKILECKFHQSLELKKMLLSTGELPLYFLNPMQGKNFWGVDTNKNGQNMLGILLVNIRKKFQG